MSNEFLHLGHDLAEWRPPSFTKDNWRIFRSICWAVQDKGEDVITIDFGRFKELTRMTEKSPENLEKKIFNTYNKIIETGWEYDDGHVHGKFNLFRAYEVDRDKETISVAVSQEFLYLLNQVKPYTPIELAEYNSLGSTYSQLMYDLIKQWRTIGVREFSIEEFREKLNIPASYDMRKITEKALKPIMDELPAYFKEFTLIKKRGQGRGGSICALRFTWTPEERNYTEVYQQPDTKTKAEKVEDLRAKAEVARNAGDIETAAHHSNLASRIEGEMRREVEAEIEGQISLDDVKEDSEVGKTGRIGSLFRRFFGRN